MSDTVCLLTDPVATEPAVSGAKGATLARLLSLGLPVPGGVVVTTETYRTVVETAGVGDLLSDLEAAVDRGDGAARADLAAELRERIRSTPLPSSVVDALDRDRPSGPVAVRSSATTEDLPGTSFAGQYDSFLGVEGTDAVATAVRDCLASLFTERAVVYRARNDIDVTDAAMAVVVHAFVEPDASGILFTADPVSGRRPVTVIDAGPGRGDRLVSGRTTADSIRFDRPTDRIVEYAVGPERSEPILSESDVRALSTLGTRIESALGSPQDVEWAIRDGDISILQARPITSLFPVPEPTPDDAVHVYYSFGHRQGMPDAMPTLVLDTWATLIESVFSDLGMDGWDIATAGNRLYIDVTPYLREPRLRRRLLDNFDVIDEPGAAAMRSFIADAPEQFPATGRGLPLAAALDNRGTLRRVVGLAYRLVGGVPRTMVTGDPLDAPTALKATYDEECDRAIERIRAPQTLPARLDAAVRELGNGADWLLDPFYSRFLSGIIAGALLRRLVPEERERVDELALGITDDVVYQMNAALADVAAVAQETPAVERALREGTTMADLRDRDDAEAFVAAVDAFLDAFGFRAVGEIDWSRPRYREDPSTLLNVVSGYIAAPDADSPTHQGDELQARAADAKAALVSAAPRPLRPLVRRLATMYRGYIGLRELPKYALVRLLDELRQQTLAAGRQLERAGALESRDDVWHLTYDELRAAVADPRTLAGVDVTARRQAYERATALAPPRLLTSEGEVLRATGPIDGTPGAVTLAGTGAAPGVVEGDVRVVTDPARTRIARGEVLVAPYTDPGWTPLFLNAAAVVTEVGGRLTHGSLVAREYGIPAVVGVDDATTRLKTGDRVRVDGVSGTVERIE
ncbi:PEP/pyruvate-binding domain-containing protein [Haloarcula marina]|uniref:PEP/pyruvate-binding domain-containing protein n=1 Tax=Haloarcula marina TaxID=2961574 RepID=UPI0020B66ECF|nr:PEP/pyruvate-binding domain-containing protein [Halomicroarcula marina]